MQFSLHFSHKCDHESPPSMKNFIANVMVYFIGFFYASGRCCAAKFFTLFFSDTGNNLPVPEDRLLKQESVLMQIFHAMAVQ